MTDQDGFTRQPTTPPTPPSGTYPGMAPTGGDGGGSPPRRPPGRSALTVVIIVAILLGLALISIMGLALLVTSIAPSDSTSGLAFGDKVGVVMVDGVIMAGGRASPLFGGPSGSRAVMSDLRSARRDREVKAAVVYINSPGGSAAASQSVFREVQKLAESKPTIAVMDDVAASGGYYIACGADEIVANGSTITGSIGVMMSGVTYHELMNKIGVDGLTITSGRYKDTGSPWRPMRPDERQLLEGLIGDIYNQFVDAVAEGRHMDRDEVLELADGRVFTGRQALELGLVDHIGTYYDAVALAAEKAGIKGEPKTKLMGSAGGFWGQMFGTRELLPLPWRRSPLDLNGPLLIEPYTYHGLLLQNLPRW